VTGPAASPPLPALSDILMASYQHFVGRPLLPPGIPDTDRARWLYEDAPFCVLAHSTDADPRFVYANRAAQARFEYSWEEFLALPSRLSAEAHVRAERERLLDAVARNGFTSGYSGLRVTKSGRRFWLEDGVVWQLVDARGAVHGQAATFPRWRDA
jgi:PAS domain-containing protein